MPVSQIFLCSLVKEMRKLGCLVTTSHRKQSINESVVLLHGEPFVADELKLFSCMNVSYDDKAKEPRAEFSLSAVIMPNANVVETAKLLGHGHYKGVGVTPSEGWSEGVDKRANARFLFLARKNELNLGVSSGAVFVTCVDNHLIEILCIGLIVR